MDTSCRKCRNGHKFRNIDNIFATLLATDIDNYLITPDPLARSYN